MGVGVGGLRHIAAAGTPLLLWVTAGGAPSSEELSSTSAYSVDVSTPVHPSAMFRKNILLDAISSFVFELPLVIP